MQPLFNSFPPQFQTNATNAPLSQQVFTPNPSLANSSNMLQNSMPMQPQMGIINPHSSNMPPLMNQPGFMSHMGMPQLGFGPQHGAPNVNALPMFSVTGQFCNFPQNQVNPSQPQGQFMHNLPQNMGLPNGQFCLQNPRQQLLPMQMQMPNPSQNMNPFGVLLGSQQAIGCPNPAFFVNSQFGLANQVGHPQVNQNQHNLVPNAMAVNASSKPSLLATPQIQGNSCTIQPKQTQNMQANGPPWSQGKPMKNGQINISNSNWNKFPSKNFNKNPKREASKQGFQKSQLHNAHNAKRKFGFSNERKGQGRANERAANSGWANSTNQAREKKRSLALTYTEQEIQQWREQRRKNYPSKGNIEKKLTENLTDSEVIVREAKMRREQLKEILAKQAELGVEVAEVPSYYLSDLGTQVHGREENRRPMTRKERFQNKHDRRVKYNKNDRFAKKQKLEDKNSSSISSYNKRKPTLLQKLLSADIKRDNRRLLQAFRFMVMNSFFKDWPEKSLKFPLVVVKESGCEGEVVERKSSLVKNDVPEGSNKTVAEDFDDDDDDDDGHDNDKGSDDDVNNEHDAQVEKVAYFVRGKGSIGEETERLEEEEGEIID